MSAAEIMRAAIKLDAQGDLSGALDLLRGHGLNISAAAVLLDAAEYHRNRLDRRK